MLVCVVQVTGGSRKREGWGDGEWNQARSSARPPWWCVTSLLRMSLLYIEIEYDMDCFYI